MWSALAAVVGALLSAALVRRVRRTGTDADAELYWGLGLAAVTPAWLIEFLNLLPVNAEPEHGVRLFVMAVIGLTVAGIVSTGAIVRRLDWSPHACWVLGVVALVPAWALTLAGRVWIRP